MKGQPGYPRQAGSNTTRYIFAITSPGSGETDKRPLDQSAPDASERRSKPRELSSTGNRTIDSKATGVINWGND